MKITSLFYGIPTQYIIHLQHVIKDSKIHPRINKNQAYISL